jgi:hypothetical protein
MGAESDVGRGAARLEHVVSAREQKAKTHEDKYEED